MEVKDTNASTNNCLQKHQTPPVSHLNGSKEAVRKQSCVMIIFGLKIASGVTLREQMHKITIYLSEMRLWYAPQSISSHRCLVDILLDISGPLKCHYLTPFDLIFPCARWTFISINVSQLFTDAWICFFACCCKWSHDQVNQIKHKCSYDCEAI